MIDGQEHLLYRRQFVLGPRAFHPTEQWKTFGVGGGLTLSTHPDLEVCTCEAGGALLVLIGCALDPTHPQRDSAQVLRAIADSGGTIAKVIEATESLSGRWVLLYRDSTDFVLFNDPCGLRQVYYHPGEAGLWCGSQPEIIAANAALRPDPDPLLNEFTGSHVFSDLEGSWAGDRTPYAECFHLTPNHYLDMNSGKTVRYFPRQDLRAIRVEEAIPVAAALLKGTIKAASHRGPLTLPVTAGWDTRVLLAASRDLIGSIPCSVDKMGDLPDSHADIWVPKRLSAKLGFKFEVEDSREDPPEWFFELLRRNVTGARKGPKVRNIYAKWRRGDKWTNLTGNVSEVCRSFYDKRGWMDQRNLKPDRLAGIFGYGKSRFAVQELTRWKAALDCCRVGGFQILDMMYWEQRMGRWGCQFAAEQDVAIEEIAPFNNRRLLTTLLAVPAEYRTGPRYRVYDALIRHLWPQAMSEPLNPEPFVTKLKGHAGALAKRWLPDWLVNALRERRLQMAVARRTRREGKRGREQSRSA